MSGGALSGRRVYVYGAGPAGCALAYLLARQSPDTKITLVEAAPDCRPSAGIVFARAFFDGFRAAYPELLDIPAGRTATWNTTLTRVGDFELGSPAHGTVAVERAALVSALRAAALAQPSVTLRAGNSTEYAAHPTDLVVAADGIGSAIRGALHRGAAETGYSRTTFVWGSVPAALPAMFDIRVGRDGMVLLHVYPHSASASTVVVEALPATLERSGLLRLSGEQLDDALTAALAGALRGERLHCMTPWRRFPSGRAPLFRAPERPGCPPVALVGDASFAAHYSVGMGTTLALQGAEALAAALATSPTLTDGLAGYEHARRPQVAAVAAEAECSRSWFETFIGRNRAGGAQTVFALRTRRSHNTFEALSRLDRGFIDAVLASMQDGMPVRSGHFEPAAHLRRPTDLPLTVCGVTFPARQVSPDMLDLITGPIAVLRSSWADDHDAIADGWPDLLFARAASAAGRIDRSRAADDARARFGLPVVYVHDGEDDDELDTLLAAGRIDLTADARVLDRGRPGWAALVGGRRTSAPISVRG